MILAAPLCSLGIPAGFLLLWRVPAVPPAQPFTDVRLSIIVPARNEAANLPRLLRSAIGLATQPLEVLVVDDGSTDTTALVAQELGATVITSAALPEGWTGKAWACHQGAQRARGDLLLFLDADTFFVPDGLGRFVARWSSEHNPKAVLSLLPYQSMEAVYEQLSLFFHLLMAAGAGGFGPIAASRAFGQSLLLSKETYLSTGGHAAVRGHVLENLYMAPLLREAGCRVVCMSGRGVLHMRMFPDGLRSMSDSWTKAFVHGASVSGGLVLATAVVWISALWLTVLLLLVLHGDERYSVAIVYVLLSVHLALVSRRLGNYGRLTCLFYPLSLTYYCIIFARSALRQVLGHKTTWRGREV